MLDLRLKIRQSGCVLLPALLSPIICLHNNWKPWPNTLNRRKGIRRKDNNLYRALIRLNLLFYDKQSWPLLPSSNIIGCHLSVSNWFFDISWKHLSLLTWKYRAEQIRYSSFECFNFQDRSNPELTQDVIGCSKQWDDGGPILTRVPLSWEIFKSSVRSKPGYFDIKCPVKCDTPIVLRASDWSDADTPGNWIGCCCIQTDLINLSFYDTICVSSWAGWPTLTKLSKPLMNLVTLTLFILSSSIPQ